MELKKIKECKKGDFVKVNGKGSVYVLNGYERSLKKYELYLYNDINKFRYINRDTLVDNDFIF